MAWNCHQIHEKREFLLGGNSYQVHFSLGHNLVTALSRSSPNSPTSAKRSNNPRLPQMMVKVFRFSSSFSKVVILRLFLLMAVLGFFGELGEECFHALDLQRVNKKGRALFVLYLFGAEDEQPNAELLQLLEAE